MTDLTKRMHCDNCGYTLGLDCGDDEPDFNDRFCSAACHEMGQQRWDKTNHMDWYTVEVKHGMSIQTYQFRDMGAALAAAFAMAQAHHTHTRIWTGWAVEAPTHVWTSDGHREHAHDERRAALVAS